MKLNTLKETFNFSKKIGQIISNGDVIFLYGEIGTGKTTFVRNLINSLELKKKIDKSEVLSPTFNIVFNYEIKDLQIMHYDLYRLKNSKDINELGIFSEKNNHLILIEWPELIEKKPKNRIEIYFDYVEGDSCTRNITVKGYGKWNNYDFKKK